MKLFAILLMLGGLAVGQSQSSSSTQQSSSNTQQSSTNTQLAMRPATQNPDEQRIVKEVRHELVMLPYYSLFDDLEQDRADRFTDVEKRCRECGKAH